MTSGIASSPVSFGVFEFTDDRDGTPAAADVLAAIRDAGYDGVEAGPDGYLGRDGAAIGARLRGASLRLAGVYVPLELTRPTAADANLRRVARALDELEAAGAGDAVLMVADAGSEARRRGIGRVLAGEPDEPDGASLDEIARQLDAIAARSAASGVVAAVHPHLGTHLETGGEIAHVLARSGIGLVFDSGHLAGAGVRPEDAVRTWRDRIVHVHLKDVRLGPLREVAARRLGLLEMWESALFCPLGVGDVELGPLVGDLLASGYDGWLVVEQDRIVNWAAEGIEHAAADQRANRAWLDGILSEEAHGA